VARIDEAGAAIEWRDWLEQRGLKSIKLNLKFAEMEFQPNDVDRKVALELITRITTQRLEPEHGDEKTALDSVSALFPLTRETLKRNGSGCIEFTKLAVVVLNQVVRPFTAEGHRRSLKGDLGTPDGAAELRDRLDALQTELRAYTKMLADLADVEDLTDLEANS
jgi:hypothetical protein